MNVSESGTKAIVKNLRSEGQTSRADYVEALQAEVTRLAAELAALTPGGSEFHNSPDNCIQWIRERLESRAKVAKERNQLRKKLAAAEKIFNHFTFDHLMKMENGEGKTPANLVQEYLEP